MSERRRVRLAPRLFSVLPRSSSSPPLRWAWVGTTTTDQASPHGPSAAGASATSVERPRWARRQRGPLFDLAFTSLSLVGVKAFFFVTTVILARGIAPSAFGTYTVASAIAIVLIPVLDFGLSNVVMRVRVRAESVAPLAVTAAADRIRIRPWIVMGCLFVFGMAVLGTMPAFLAVLTFSGAVAQTEVETMAGELRSAGQYATSASLRTVTGVLSLPLAALAVTVEPSAVGAMLVFALCRIGPALLLRVRSGPRRLARMATVTLRSGIPFAFASTIIILYVQSDVIFLSAFHVPGRLIAGYGVAYSILAALQMLPAAIAYIVYTHMVQADPTRARSLAGLAIAASFSTAGFAAAAALASPSLTFAAFGSTYEHEAALVIPLVAVLLPLSGTIVTSTLLQARGHEARVMHIAIATFLVNVGLNIWLIPDLGVRGALIATSCAEVLSACAGAYALWRLGLANCFGLCCAFGAIPLSMTVLQLRAPVAAIISLMGAGVVLATDTYGARSNAWRLVQSQLQRASNA